MHNVTDTCTDTIHNWQTTIAVFDLCIISILAVVAILIQTEYFILIVKVGLAFKYRNI